MAISEVADELAKAGLVIAGVADTLGRVTSAEPLAEAEGQALCIVLTELSERINGASRTVMQLAREESDNQPQGK